MSITIWVGIYGLLIGFGAGQRVALYYQRKAAKLASAAFMAKAAELDARITEAQD